METKLPSASARPSVDRVRMIRRSIRCFAFGLVGAVPLFGLGTAFLALRLHRELARESGVPVRATGLDASTVIAFALLIALCYFNQAGLVLAAGFLISGLEGYLLLLQYRRIELSDWNPARNLAWWGAGLAYTGLNLSVTIIVLGIWSAIHKD
jgi:hypothetical protein